jgi:hypothetical protein
MGTSETLCFAYTLLPTIPMETFLYHSEYHPYNEDITGDHTIDDLLYYQLFECAGLFP